MPYQEINPTVRRQIEEIFDTSTLLLNRLGENQLPEIQRFEACTNLISRTKEALLRTPEYAYAAANKSLEASNNRGVSFRLGKTEYEVYYFKGEVPNGSGAINEVFYLIKNREEKITLHTFQYNNGRKEAHTGYSDFPDDEFRKYKYCGDQQSIEEIDRLITELELASE